MTTKEKKMTDEEAKFYEVDEERFAKHVESLLDEICIKMTDTIETVPVHGVQQQTPKEWKVSWMIQFHHEIIIPSYIWFQTIGRIWHFFLHKKCPSN